MVPARRRVALVLIVASALVLGGCLSDSPSGEGTPTENGSVNGSEVVASFEERMASLDSYTVTITNRMTMGENTTRTTTKYWARPETGEVRQRIVSSGQYGSDGTVIVSNNSATVRYNPETNNVTTVDTSTFEQGGSPNGGGVLTFLEVYEPKYLDRVELDGEPAYKISLEPANDTMGTVNMTAWLDTETHFPVRMETEMGGEALNSTIRTVMTVEDVTLNPDIPDERFSIDVPADANRSEISLPESESFDSRAALSSATEHSVPDPTVPSAYSFESGRVTRGEVLTIALVYENGDGTVRVSKRNQTLDEYENVSDDGETVEIGSITGEYREIASNGFVSWTCDDTGYTVSGEGEKATLLDVAASIECE